MTNQPVSNDGTSDRHVIIGAGAVGSAVARRLVAAGKTVIIVTRSGGGIDSPGIRKVALDAGNADELTAAAEDAVAIYNCANPRYSRWATDWPPLANSILVAAERTGAVLVTMGNLYLYEEPSITAPGQPVRLTEDSPLNPSSRKGAVRLAMWEAAKASHDAGRSRVTEVRASDFIGAGVGANGHFADRAIPRILKSKSVSLVAATDQLHSWSAIEDVARALVTVAAEPSAWGKAWHVPTAPPVTFGDLVETACKVAGVESVKVKTIPGFALGLLGIFSADIRGLKEMRYQFESPFVMDSSAFVAEFGWGHTPLEDTVRVVVESYGVSS